MTEETDVTRAGRGASQAAGAIHILCFPRRSVDLVPRDTEHLQPHLLSSWVEIQLNSHGAEMEQGGG